MYISIQLIKLGFKKIFSITHFRKLKNIPSKIIKSVKHVYGSLVGYQEYTRFVSISYARTGSNYLLNGLDSSKSVYVYHEIFADHNRKLNESFDQILSALYQKQDRTIQAVGFKLFYYHLSDEEWSKFLLHDDFKIIHLIRKNRLRTLVSLDIAFKTNHWVSGIKKDDPEAKSIILDPNNIMERLEEIELYENITRERYKSRELLEVVYEDLEKNPSYEFKRIGDFLEVNDIDPKKINLDKQNPEDLKLLITNFKEIAQVLKSTRFAEYLYS